MSPTSTTCYNNMAHIENNHIVPRFPTSQSASSGLSELPLKVAASTNEQDEPISGEGIHLKRRVGLVSGVALIVGTMIGSGIFVSPKGVLLRSGSVGLSLVIWGACGLLSLLGALCYAELGTFVPMSGGEYAYLLTGFKDIKPLPGPLPAFLYSWMCVLLLKPSSLAVLSLSFAEYSVQALYSPGCFGSVISKKLIGIICVCIITFVNCYSVNLATRVQNLFTAAKLLAIAIIIGGGLVKIAQGHTQYLAAGFQGSTTSFSDVATAFYSGLWAYDGWNNLNYVTEELINPYVNLPRSIAIAIPLVTLCYVMVNISYMTVMSSSELLASEAVAVGFANHVLSQAAAIIPIFVAVSTYGAGNGSCFTAARLSYVAAREGHLVDVLSYVHVRRLTPSPALIFNAFIAICMIIPGNIGSLIDFFSFTAWLFYGGTMLALIVMRWTKKDVPRPYKVPIIIPIFVLIISVYLVLAPIIQNPQIEYLYATLFIVSGLIFYIPFVYYKFQLKIMGRITLFFQLLLEVAPTQYMPD
ncbi:b(0,+)-type amino acid transporter 1 isoform X3 [Centruroides vittatus]|uniref:b(0,+)-type amino acid transporter 1 isoform X3 n=1 Tax=Centruroides vittatus TaxID=120091 RepID=UPI0035100695